MHWGEPTGAPVSGEVFGLTAHAPQEVVRPGETILQIVPEDAGLVVMARLNPIDGDQVYPGQAAALRAGASRTDRSCPILPRRCRGRIRAVYASHENSVLDAIGASGHPAARG